MTAPALPSNRHRHHPHPDRLAREAHEVGLLAPDALADLIESGVRQKALQRIRSARGKENGEKPLSLAQLQEIVAAVRKRAD